MDGRTLTFRLIGINNQNFLMEDRETGSWWQQVTGQAISGPLEGRRLTPVLHDEVTFAVWRGEHPASRVLALDAQGSRISRDWETRTARSPVVPPARDGDPLPPRALVVGVARGGESRAYPADVVAAAGVVLDELAGQPIAILDAGDGRSVRVFAGTVSGATLQLVRRTDTMPATFVDAATGSTFDFAGRALSGALVGTTLERVPHLSDYWFDWRTYHPSTTVYAPR